MFTKKILRGSFPKVVLNVYLVSKVEQLRLECIVKISTVSSNTCIFNIKETLTKIGLYLKLSNLV